MFIPRRRALFRRGILRHLILRTLTKGPMHGYEVIRSLSEEFGGFYRPSAGSVYPLLRTLEGKGYITVEEEGNKKIYSITSKGREFLKKNEAKVKDLIEKGRSFLQEKRGLNREIRNLTSLIIAHYRDLTPEKDEKIFQILKEARRKITDIVFEEDF